MDKYFTPEKLVPHFPVEIFEIDYHFAELPFHPYSSWNICILPNFLAQFKALPLELREKIYEEIVFTEVGNLTSDGGKAKSIYLHDSRFFLNKSWKPSPVHLALRQFHTQSHVATAINLRESSFRLMESDDYEVTYHNSTAYWQRSRDTPYSYEFGTCYYANIIGFTHTLVLFDRQTQLALKEKSQEALDNDYSVVLKDFVSWLWSNLLLDVGVPASSIVTNPYSESKITTRIDAFGWVMSQADAYARLSHIALSFQPEDNMNPDYPSSKSGYSKVQRLGHFGQMCSLIRLKFHNLQTLRLDVHIYVKDIENVLAAPRFQQRLNFIEAVQNIAVAKRFDFRCNVRFQNNDSLYAYPNLKWKERAAMEMSLGQELKNLLLPRSLLPHVEGLARCYK